MVNSALKEQVEQLDEADLIELRGVIDAKLDDYVLPAIAAIVDQRIAEADANPDDYITLDDFERKLRARSHSA